MKRTDEERRAADAAKHKRAYDPAKRRERTRRESGSTKEKRAAYYLSHIENERRRNKEYAKSHPEVRARLLKAWRGRHRAHVSAYLKCWYAAHPESQRAKEYRRRSRKKGGLDGSVARLWSAKVRAYDSRCAYCASRVSRPQQDHVIPVSKGGRHVIGNVVPCCPNCNRKKSAALWAPRPWAAMLPKEAAR